MIKVKESMKIFEIIEILFATVVLSVLIIIAFFFNGFNIDKIILNNIELNGLYLKYDKSLFVRIDNISLKEKSETKKYHLDFKIDYLDHYFLVDIKDMKIGGTDIEFDGLVKIKDKDINLVGDKKFIIANAKLQFDKNMDKFYANLLNIRYKNQIFYITSSKLEYKNTDITGSKVIFDEKKNSLTLNVKTKSLYTSNIKKILNYYDVHIPFEQKNGVNNISAIVTIPFSQNENEKVDVKVNFKSTDTNISAFTNNFYFKKLDLTYENNIVKSQGIVKDSLHNIEADFTNILNLRSMITNGKAKINYQKDDMTLTSNSVIYSVDLNNTDTILVDLKSKETYFKRKDINITLRNAKVSKLGDDISASFAFSTNKYETKGYLNSVFNIKDLSLTGTAYLYTSNIDNMVNIKNEKFDFKLVKKGFVKLNIPKYNLNANFYNQGGFTVDIKKPIKLAKLINNISLTNNSDLNNNGTLFISQSSHSSNISVRLANLNMYIDDNIFMDFNNKKDNKSTKYPDLNIEYNKSIIKYKEYQLPFDRLKIDMKGENLDALVFNKNAKINVGINKDFVSITGTKLNGIFLNTIINKDIFEGGYVDFNMYGKNTTVLSGDTHFYDIKIKNVPVVNNLISFVNTTPAIVNPLLALPTLFRMAENGFDTNGYYINKGDGTFVYNTRYKILNIYDLFTDGSMANFRVNSSIDIKNDKLKSEVDIEFLKDYSGIINKIPLVGYILMGDDGAITTSVDINGTLNKQEITTNTIEDTATGILGIFGRIITLPFKPFMNDEVK